MADDPAHPPVSEASVGAVLRVVEGLRSDMREDNAALRDDMRERDDALRGVIDDVERRVMTALTDFSVAHGREHTEEREASHAAHSRFDAFIRNAELEQARRQGALGVFRFAVEQVSRHSGPLVKVLVALGGALAVATGAFRVELVIK